MQNHTEAAVIKITVTRLEHQDTFQEETLRIAFRLQIALHVD